MLRQFSVRRIIAFLTIDWLGTLGLPLLAARLRIGLGELPTWLVSFLGALGIHYRPGWTGVTSPADILLPQLFVLVAIIWPVFLLVFSVYDGRRNETLRAELRNVFFAVGASTMTLAGCLYFTYRETPRVLLLLFFLVDLILLLGTRVAWWTYRKSRNGKRQAQRNVLVVGAGPVGCNVVEQIRHFAWADLNLVGYADDDPAKQGQEFEGLPVLGTLDQIPQLVADYEIRDAVVALPLRAHERLVEVARTLQKLPVHVHVIPDLFALSFPGAALDGFGGIPVIDLGQPGIYGWRRFLKRAFDTALAAVMLLLTSPLLLIVAIMIRLESPGPAIYTQERVGENGRLFTMYKFRSMRAGADPGVHQTYVTRLIQENMSAEQINASEGNGQGTLKMEDDPRITRVGKFIRKISIDELPQFWNVLRGEMSLVGPRPPIPYEVAVYKDWHKRRLEAIPGITGLWQVKGRNQVSFDEMVRMDLEYIERQSLWLDIKILVQTPVEALLGRGAG